MEEFWKAMWELFAFAAFFLFLMSPAIVASHYVQKAEEEKRKKELEEWKKEMTHERIMQGIRNVQSYLYPRR